ncbi:MAG: hypothetical protein M0R74_05690, partial [Dehalococcoidia bacterium]|nr:hypothetical protein [Dehalococcoidia bacterium]
SPIRLAEFDLTDRASVQSLVDTVIRLELTGRLPDARARRLIRLLSIAIRNFDPPRFVPREGRLAFHERYRYENLRRHLESRLDEIFSLADANDAARNADS